MQFQFSPARRFRLHIVDPLFVKCGENGGDDKLTKLEGNKTLGRVISEIFDTNLKHNGKLACLITNRSFHICGFRMRS